MFQRPLMCQKIKANLISHIMTPLIRLVRSRCICRRSCRRCWWLWLCCLFLCCCWGSQYKNTSHTRGRELRFLWATLLNSSTSVFVCVWVTMLSSSVGRHTSFASRKRLYKCSPGRGGCKRRRRRGGKREIGESRQVRCVCVCVCVCVYKSSLHCIQSRYIFDLFLPWESNPWPCHC